VNWSIADSDQVSRKIVFDNLVHPKLIWTCFEQAYSIYIDSNSIKSHNAPAEIGSLVLLYLFVPKTLVPKLTVPIFYMYRKWLYRYWHSMYRNWLYRKNVTKVYVPKLSCTESDVPLLYQRWLYRNWHVFGRVHSGTTWRIHLNCAYVAAVQPFSQITLTTCYGAL